MKKRKLALLILSITIVNIISAKEYHVAKTGHDSNNGSFSKPFKTISKAVAYAFPGDTITIHKGVYREWVNPLRGGDNDSKRILYRAAPREKVEIKGSEVVSNWEKVSDGIWKTVIPNTFFKDYNPFKDTITGDWFKDWGRPHHTGDVFLNGQSLFEKESRELLENSNSSIINDNLGNGYTWYCESDKKNTTIWANFHNFNPNKELTEISARKTCFYPSKPNINYITIRGFDFSQAATQWAAPTAEQIGMIATHWNKGWIIENNSIHDSRCSGITLGKEKNTGHNVWSADPSVDGSIHYIEVIFKALRAGWSKDKIGSHIVRNNEIYNCEQTGICGSFGAAFSTIENNHIHHIWTKRQFGGAELAGVKFHGAIDLIFKKNRINDCGRGLWLDWMTQGARISQNLMYRNDKEDIWFEVNHGPYLVDNNILLSKVGIVNQSTGGAYVNNLFTGETRIWAEPSRFTPYQLPHSTEIAGVSGIIIGDERFYNNIFIGVGKDNGLSKFGINYYGLSTYNDSIKLAWGRTEKRKIQQRRHINKNVYYNGAIPYKKEVDNFVDLDFNPTIKLIEENNSVFLTLNFGEELSKINAQLINTSILGKTKTTKTNFENPNGSPLEIDYDFMDNKRSSINSLSGPFSEIKNGFNKIKVW